jgi:cyclic-di-GMP-binding biofilm dispersal mediator protein
VSRSLDGARVLVVGATGGIGGVLVTELAGRGARIAAASRSVAFGDVPEAETAVRCDLADQGSVLRALGAAAGALGGLDGVAVCAGAVAFGPLDGLPEETLERLIDVNLLGPLALARVALPVLDEGGFLLNVSGVVAELPTAGLVVYSAAKAGASAGFRALAREARPRGITVIDVRPPHTATGLETRPLHGHAPAMPPGLDPRAVVSRLVRAIEENERELAASAFAGSPAL